MPTQSATRYTQSNPNDISPVGLVAGQFWTFISDGTAYVGPGGNPTTNVAGALMKMSSTGILTPQVVTFTSEDAQDAFNLLFTSTGGTIAGTYNDVANTFNFDVSAVPVGLITGFAEAVQDVFGGVGFVTSTGGTIVATYNDGANTFNFEVGSILASQVSNFAEAVDDRFGAFFLDSTTIDGIYDDAGNAFTAEFRLPPSPLITGVNRIYAQTDHGKYLRRSNGGAAMADTLPGGVINGTLIKVQNVESETLNPTANIVFSTTGGATIGETGATTYTLKPGARQTFVYEAAANVYRFDAGNGNLLKTYTGAAVGDILTIGTATGLTTAKATSRQIADATNDSYGIVNILDFGADRTGATSSRTALDQAIAYLVAKGGAGVVYFPPGTYNLGNIAYLISNAHITLRGASRYSTNIVTTSTTLDMIQIGQYYNIIEDLTFIGPGSGENPTRTAGFAINGNGAGFPASTEIRRCTFFYQFSAINLANSLMNVEDIEVKFYKGVGIQVDHNSDHQIDKAIMNNNAAFPNTGGAGIRVLQTASLQMQSLNIISSWFALDIAPAVGVTTPSIKAVNCFFDTSVVGLNMTSAGSMLRSEFTNCWFSSMSVAGIRLNPTTAGGVNGVTFVNCDVYNNVGGTTQGIDTNTNVGKWKAVGCSIAGWTTGVNLVAGAMHYPSLVANSIGAISAFGVNALAIAIGAGAFKGLTIQSNDLNDNTVILTDGSTGSFQKLIADNLGLPVAPAPQTAATLLPITTVTKVANSCFLTANSLRVGTIIRATAILSKITATADATATTRMTYNTTDVSTTSLLTMTLAGTAATGQARLVYEFCVRSVGPGGTATVAITLNNLGATGVDGVQSRVNIAAAAAINTTVDNYLGIWASAAVASDHRYESVFWEVVSQ